MSDTAFKSSSLPGTTEVIFNMALPECAENPLPAAALIEPAHHSNQPDAPLKIAGEQTIRTAGELHRVLAEYVDGGRAVAVDLSEVHECDTAALQLIYALRQSVVQRKQLFQITAVSPAITETAAALGLRIEGLTTAFEEAGADGDCGVIDSGV